jgi:hypothetical protein
MSSFIFQALLLLRFSYCSLFGPGFFLRPISFFASRGEILRLLYQSLFLQSTSPFLFHLPFLLGGSIFRRSFFVALDRRDYSKCGQQTTVTVAV